MSEKTWNKGNPPHIGWWLVKCYPESPERWGWFDGEWWSTFCTENETAIQAADCARVQGFRGPEDGVLWSSYYPNNARVKRINPNSP